MLHLKPDKSMLLKLSVRSVGSEFQIVWAAWQNARLPKTVLAPASWSRQWSLEWRWRDDVRNWSKLNNNNNNTFVERHSAVASEVQRHWRNR